MMVETYSLSCSPNFRSAASPLGAAHIASISFGALNDALSISLLLVDIFFRIAGRLAVLFKLISFVRRLQQLNPCSLVVTLAR